MRLRAVPGFAFLAIAIAIAFAILGATSPDRRVFAILGVVFLVLGIAQLVRRRNTN